MMSGKMAQVILAQVITA